MLKHSISELDLNYMLSPKLSQVRLVRPPYDVGMGPVSLLDRTSKYVRFFIVPKAEGRDPVRFFMLLKSSLVRCVSFAKDGDIVPV